MQHLIQEGYLAALSELGMVVSQLPTPRAGDRKYLLTHEVEPLVVEARRVDLAAAVSTARRRSIPITVLSHNEVD